MHYLNNSFISYPQHHAALGHMESSYMKRISPDNAVLDAKLYDKHMPQVRYSGNSSAQQQHHPYATPYRYYESTTTTTTRGTPDTDLYASSKPEGIKKKKRKTKKNKIIIPMKDMIRLFPLPQTVAAKKLNVSISTLKRRFYELEMPKWPANHTMQEFNFGEINRTAMKSSYHKEFVNSTITLKQNAHYYLLHKEPSTTEKTQIGTLLNLYNTSSEKDIDPMTRAILHEAFLENVERPDEDDSSSDSS